MASRPSCWKYITQKPRSRRTSEYDEVLATSSGRSVKAATASPVSPAMAAGTSQYSDTSRASPAQRRAGHRSRGHGARSARRRYSR
jgi:hypothetical protein